MKVNRFGQPAYELRLATWDTYFFYFFNPASVSGYAFRFE
mgnify:FL=1